MRTAVGICCLFLIVMPPFVQAEELFHLSFDRMERTPARVRLLPDQAKTPAEILMSDSGKLVKGINGLGVYMDDRADYLYFDGGGNILPEQGAVSFWLRPMWRPDDGRDKCFFMANFDQGSILLWSNSLSSMVSDKDGKQSYVPSAACADTSGWQAGEWHHVVLNWSAAANRRQLFIDGEGRAPAGYSAPAGGSREVYLSPPPSDTSGRYPACSVMDEFAIYDCPLDLEEIQALHEAGRQALAGFVPSPTLQISVYPNLAEAAKLVMWPKPNYGPPVYSSVCNDPEDAKQLSDSEWGAARYNDLRSVGWVTGRVVLDYDLGALKRIGALAVNMGAGGAGTTFPGKVLFKAGASPDRLTLLGEISTAEPYPNPKHPKWRGRTVGLDGLDDHARFVTVEIDGAVFLDEVLIVEKGAKPALRRVEVELPGKPVEAAAEQKELASGPPEGKWQIKLRNAETRLFPEDELVVEAVYTGPVPPKHIDLAYTSEMLVRGDSIYSKSPSGGLSRTPINSEMRTVMEGSKTLQLGGVENDVSRATLALPLTANPYGLFYLTVAALDEEGNELATGTFPYEVLVRLPKAKPNNIAGYDGHGWIYAWHAFDSPSNKPNDSHDRFLLDYGHSWTHPRTQWPQIHRKPGDMERRRFDILDLWVDSARKQDARIVMCLADAIPKAIYEDGSLFEPMFREWAEALMSRYGDKVAVWDVWNEPDSKSYAQTDDRDILAMKIVHELKEKHSPGSAVIVSAHTSLGLNYVKRILDKGAGRYLDGIGLHPYRGLAPEIPEADGYAGNPTGMRTLMSSLAHAREMLLEYRVEPADIYITEANYALNLVPQYDDNDQANFMVRMTILAWTTDYVKCLLHHAFGNGRLAPSAYPNMVRHMMDTAFWKKLDAGDAEIYAYAFRKGDGRVIIPLWSIKADKLVRVTGLAGKPIVTDIYGNELRIEYDAEATAVDFLQISQAPTYIDAPRGSDPTVTASRRLEIEATDTIDRGSILALAAEVKSLPVEKAMLTLQSAAGWRPPSVSYEVTGPGRFPFNLQTPSTADPGTYPVVISLTDESGRMLGVASHEVQIVLPQAELERKYGIVLSADFERNGLADWQVQENPQYDVRVAEEEENRVLRITQKGVDYAAAVNRLTPRVKYGALEFDIKASAMKQSLTVHLGEMTLEFDGKQSVGMLDRAGKMSKAGGYEFGRWHRVRIFFAAPEGWCRLWLDAKFLGQLSVPANPDGYAEVRFLSGTQSTGKPAVFCIDNARLIRVEPTSLDGKTPLRWTICGPFSNRIDPQTMKRPFEIGTDYLAPAGGEPQLDPYPGLTVPDGAGDHREFHAFYESKHTQSGGLVDFFTVKDLGLHPDQGDILCYAGAFVISPDEKEATIGIGSDDGYVLWVNHERIGTFNAWPTGRGTGGPQEHYKVRLRMGLNLILLKVDQGSGAYKFFFAIR